MRLLQQIFACGTRSGSHIERAPIQFPISQGEIPILTAFLAVQFLHPFQVTGIQGICEK